MPRTRRRRIVLGSFALLASILAACAAAAYAEYHASSAQATWYPSPRAVIVYLRSDNFSWAVDSVRDLAETNTDDLLDRKSASYFELKGDEWGVESGRPWKQRWTLGPTPSPKSARPDPRRAIAREGLARAIERREVGWPRGLARTDTATIWRPWNLLLNGFEREPWLVHIVGIGLGGVGICAALSRRKVKPGHCPTCGYNLKGLATGQCPECGSAAA